MTGDPVAEAAAAARDGRLIVFPTDTVYGIATRPDDPSATGLLFEAKQRRKDLQLPILGATALVLSELAIFDERADRLAGAFWPGPLTLVLPRATASTDWELGGDPLTLGVRVPRHSLAQAVLLASGPLATTSANRSGEPPASSCEELERCFGELVSVYLCQEVPPRGPGSTVLDLSKGRARVLRSGALGTDQLERVLSEPLLDSRPSPGE